ncbi:MULTISPECIES: hypothetical protein [Asticcacaulis]|uniref:hypothetical protein n=1 Tax=Asticcacaulis TaxID=76890 RepID=UPI001AE88E28|nr:MULTISPECIES: hypothetical protein [Asticcacaulis]MBP2157819.1 hypothetical protein [Asticcacaulis solisilvae]MDR6798864.1 hypothetical protein [Asticcacaulis sp. BE141]
MSVSIIEPHDSYAALKPAPLAWYGAPLRGALPRPLPSPPAKAESAPRPGRPG